jgi:hypothetical protein
LCGPLETGVFTFFRGPCESRFVNSGRSLFQESSIISCRRACWWMPGLNVFYFSISPTFSPRSNRWHQTSRCTPDQCHFSPHHSLVSREAFPDKLTERGWYFIAEQPAPAPHLARPEGCAALCIVLVTVPNSHPLTFPGAVSGRTAAMSRRMSSASQAAGWEPPTRS